MNWYVSKQDPRITWGLDDLIELLREQAESFEPCSSDDAGDDLVYLWAKRGSRSLIIYRDKVCLIENLTLVGAIADPIQAILGFLREG